MPVSPGVVLTTAIRTLASFSKMLLRWLSQLHQTEPLVPNYERRSRTQIPVDLPAETFIEDGHHTMIRRGPKCDIQCMHTVTPEQISNRSQMALLGQDYLTRRRTRRTVFAPLRSPMIRQCAAFDRYCDASVRGCEDSHLNDMGFERTVLVRQVSGSRAIRT